MLTTMQLTGNTAYMYNGSSLYPDNKLRIQKTIDLDPPSPNSFCILS